MPELRNARQERFCNEYLKDLNATAAAIRAGYAATTENHRLLQQEHIQARIAELGEARKRELKLDAAEIITELLRLLRSDPIDIIRDDGSVKPISEMPLDVRRAIAAIEVDTVGTGAVTRTKVKFWSKEKAIELLGRHLTLFKDVVAVEDLGKVGDAIVAARNRIAQREAEEVLEEVSAESLV
jgi:phage terminase small subunit